MTFEHLLPSWLFNWTGLKLVLWSRYNIEPINNIKIITVNDDGFVSLLMKGWFVLVLWPLLNAWWKSYVNQVTMASFSLTYCHGNVALASSTEKEVICKFMAVPISTTLQCSLDVAQSTVPFNFSSFWLSSSSLFFFSINKIPISPSRSQIQTNIKSININRWRLAIDCWKASPPCPTWINEYHWTFDRKQ